MFDIAWSEMVLIGGVALIVIGPKDLPGALRTAGQAIGKIRRMASEFQGQFNDAMREAELTDLKKQVEDIGASVQASTNFDPIEPMKDFGAAEPSKPAATEPAMKEAEAKLASLPGPEPLPEIAIDPAPAAEPHKPKRRRKTVATQEPVVPATAEAEPEAPARPARKRKPKQAAEDGSAA
jgi:sec-independent protein translocase protein TatB